MVNLMNVAAPQESADTGRPVSAASQKSHAPPETQGLFAMLFQALQSLAQPVTDGGPAHCVSDGEPDFAAGEPAADIVDPADHPPIDMPAAAAVDMTDASRADSGRGPVAGSVVPTAGTEATAVAGAVAQTTDPVPTVDEPVSGVPEQVSSIPTANGRAHVSLSRISAMPVAPDVEHQSLDAGSGGGGTQPSGTRMAGLQESLAARQTNGAQAPARDGPAVDVVSFAARPAEVALPGTASVRTHSVDESQRPATDTAVPSAPARLHLATSVPREAAAASADLHSAAISAARNVAHRTDGTPNVQNPDLGGHSAGAQTASRDTGSAVQSQRPLAESVGAAQPEVDGSVRDNFSTVERMVADQIGLTGRDAGRSSVGRLGRPALIGRSVETPAPLVGQVVKVVRMLTNEQRTEMRVRMWPPNLGELNVRLVHEGDILRVQLAAETGAARDLLDARLPQLRHALAEVGGRANDVSVTVTATEQPALAAFTANHGAGHTPYQQAGRPHEPPQGTMQHAEPPDQSAGDGSGTRSVLTAGHIDVHA